MSAQISRDDWKGRVGGLGYRNQASVPGMFVDSLTGKTSAQDHLHPAGLRNRARADGNHGRA